MDAIRLWFYAAIGAIASFFTITNLIMKWRARGEKRLNDARAYMERRHYLNDYIVEEWLQLDPYAEWLKKRLDKPLRKPNSHARSVTNDELDGLINDCIEFAKFVRKAFRTEEKISKVLTRNGYLKPSLVEHQMWHQIYRETRHYLQHFKAKRLNADRRDAR